MSKYRIIENVPGVFRVQKLEWTYRKPLLPWMGPEPVQEWKTLGTFFDLGAAELALATYIEADTFKPVVHKEVEA